jgi:hypothetical protein
MLNLVTLSKQSAVAQQRSATCAGYWLENSIGGFTSDNTSIRGLETKQIVPRTFIKRSR